MYATQSYFINMTEIVFELKNLVDNRHLYIKFYLDACLGVCVGVCVGMCECGCGCRWVRVCVCVTNCDQIWQAVQSSHGVGHRRMVDTDFRT